MENLVIDWEKATPVGDDGKTFLYESDIAYGDYRCKSFTLQTPKQNYIVCIFRNPIWPLTEYDDEKVVNDPNVQLCEFFSYDPTRKLVMTCDEINNFHCRWNKEKFTRMNVDEIDRVMEVICKKNQDDDDDEKLLEAIEEYYQVLGVFK